jgi:hypothetical protein
MKEMGRYPTPKNARYKDSGGGRAELKQNFLSSSSDNKDQTMSMCQKGRSGGASKNKGMYQK